MQDGGLTRHEHMFARRPDGSHAPRLLRERRQWHERRRRLGGQREANQRPGEVERDATDVDDSSRVSPVMTRTARKRNCGEARRLAGHTGPRRPARQPPSPDPAAPACLALGADPDHVPDQAARSSAADDQRREVELPAAEAVARPRSGRRGGCCARPRRRRRREPGEVARLVGGREAPAAEDVAERVDAVGDVVQDEDPHRAAPEQPGQPARDDPADRPRRARTAAPGPPRPERRRCGRRSDHRVGDQVGRVTLARCRAGRGRNSQPTCA